MYIKGVTFIKGVVLLQFLIHETLQEQSTSIPEFLIDDRFSLVISNDPGGSYFGASSALLPRSTGPGQSPDTWIFIGEPRGNISWDTKSGVQPGIVWRCKVTDLDIEDINCDPFTAGSIPSDVNNRNERSWFGGSVVTTPDKSVVTSAYHLAIKNKDKNKYGMPGACYLLRASSKNFDPLMVPDEYFRREENFAAFGISLQTTETDADERNKNNILAGAPVFHYGRGAIGLVKISGNSPTINWMSSSEEQPYSYFGYAVSSGKYFSNSKTYYAGGLPRANDLKGKVTLFLPPACSSVSGPCSGTIEGPKSLYGFHVGSYFGSVLYSMDIDGDGIDELFVGAPMSCYWDNINQIQNHQTQNSSDADDGLKRHRNYRDNGCVYVYKMSNNEDSEVVQILTGGRIPYARFGSAISALEKFQSIKRAVIVVGAPYENNNGGAVYFYDGRQILKTGEYTKRIAAGDQIFSSLRQRLQGLGYSFSHSNDIDGNETPDIVIGSYNSSQAIVVRTRQYMKILPTSVSFKHNEGSSEPADKIKVIRLHKDKTNFKLVVVVACSFDIEEPKVIEKVRQESLVVWSRLKVDEGFRRFDLSMDDASINHTKPNTNTIEFAVKIAFENKTYSWKEAVILAKIQNYDDTLSEIQPLQISVQSWFNSVADIPPLVLSYDIQDRSKPRNTAYPFRRFWPAPNSNMERVYPPIKIIHDCIIPGSCVANINIIDAGFFSVKNGMYRSIKRLAVGSSPEVVLRWKLANFADDKADSPATLLSFNHPHIVLISEICKPTSAPRSYWCNQTGSLPPLKKGIITMEAKFGIKSEYLANNIYAPLSVNLETYYFHSKYGMDKKDAVLELFVDSKIILRGTTTEISLEDLTVPPKISYQVLLTGMSSIQNINLNLWIPTKRKNDLETMIVFYNEEIKMLSGGFEKYNCTPQGQLSENLATSPQPSRTSTLNLISVKPTEQSGYDEHTTINSFVDAGRRKRRSLDEIRRTSRLTFDPNSTIQLNCDEDRELCVNVKCSFMNVQSKTNFKIEFRLNVQNYTVNLLKDILDTLLISSTGTAVIFEGNQTSGNISEVKIIKGRHLNTGPPPPWLYILAVLGGLLFFLLIFTVLYKCGFFKRGFKEKLDELKSQSEAILGENAKIEGEDALLQESRSSECLLDN